MEITNMERLLRRCTSWRCAVLKYIDRVFVAEPHRQGGFSASVYEFLETPDELGLNESECRLSLIHKADERFTDSGHAIVWCLSRD